MPGRQAHATAVMEWERQAHLVLVAKVVLGERMALPLHDPEETQRCAVVEMEGMDACTSCSSAQLLHGYAWTHCHRHVRTDKQCCLMSLQCNSCSTTALIVVLQS